MQDDVITLDYGSGGKKTAALIDTLLLPALDNPVLRAMGDGALVELAGPLAFSTDSFVVSPRFFPGGDIGKLSVCGTVNDLCMCGAQPRYLSLALIIEEGLPMAELARIVASIGETAKACGVRVVTGDIKVVERGRGDGLYINTAGIGTLCHAGLSTAAIREGDAVLVSGPVGDHGAAVMLARSGMRAGEAVLSDCAPLIGLASAAWAFGPALRVLRDPTRGGVATTLNEFVEARDFEYGIELEEAALPIRPAVRAVCDALGLDPLYCACEGRMLCVAAAEQAQALLAALRGVPGGGEAAVIGRVSRRAPGRVVLHTAMGGSRILAKLTGAQLPRIC